MDRRAFIATGATALTTGCLRLTGSGGGGSTATETATAVDVDEAEASNTDAATATDSGPRQPSFPPGLSEDGVGPFLHSTHTSELSTHSFATEWTLVVDDGDGSTIKQQKQYRKADNRALGSWRFREGGPVVAYQNTEGGFWREDLGDRYTYGEERDPYQLSDMNLPGWTAPLIELADWGAPELVRRERPARWQTEAVGFVETPKRIGYHSDAVVTDLSARMTVSERGIIREFQAAFALETSEGRTPTYQVSHSITQIGSITVSKPDWLPTAKERTPTASGTLTDDGFVEFTLESGNRLEPGTDLTVYDGSAETNAITYELAEPIEVGETVYLWRESADGPDQMSRGGRPSDASPVPLDSNVYRMWADRGSVEYFGVLWL